MKFTDSLKKNYDFKYVYNHGKSRADRFLVIYVCENHQGVNRIGVSVSKKVGNSVVRHRIKRLVKECYRIQETSFQNGLDIIAVARSAAADADFYRIRKSLLGISSAMGILRSLPCKEDEAGE